MSSKVASVFLGLLWFTCITNGCRCFPKHPQRIVCERNVAFVGKVTSEVLPTSVNDFNIEYHFTLLKSIKGIFKPVGSTIIVRVPSLGSLCGYKLTVGEQYVLTGTKNNQGITSTTCGDFHYKVCDLTFQMVIYLFTNGQYSYKNNCSCKEIINPRHEPGIFDESKGCKLPAELNADTDCYDKTGLCKRHGTVCKWKNVVCP
ncbi:metalloproteinase inhibitor 1-like [Mytilus trossulus]|uniref:metalloproteinase inhibitor 1-like n=1 Tax=Mytilus trossulus TaxID=6551 RepID=UPI003005C103